MKCDLTNIRENDINRRTDNMQLIRAWSLVYVDGDFEIIEGFTARWYMGKSASASRIYCNIWLRGGKHVCGSGWAGGYGYCKMSAAFEAACDAAGIKFDEAIGGRGESAVMDAMESTLSSGFASARNVQGHKIIRHG